MFELITKLLSPVLQGVPQAFFDCDGIIFFFNPPPRA